MYMFSEVYSYGERKIGKAIFLVKNSRYKIGGTGLGRGVIQETGAVITLIISLEVKFLWIET